MAKAVAVGEKHLVLGFRGVGFDIIAVDDVGKLADELSALARDPEVGLVVMTESLASEAPETVEEFRSRSKAVVTLIPTHEGGRHLSFESIRRAVERSMGVDLLGKE